MGENNRLARKQKTDGGVEGKGIQRLTILKISCIVLRSFRLDQSLQCFQVFKAPIKMQKMKGCQRRARVNSHFSVQDSVLIISSKETVHRITVKEDTPSNLN